jgi:hypothetical protein
MQMTGNNANKDNVGNNTTMQTTGYNADNGQ